jgi:hypothetical protein
MHVQQCADPCCCLLRGLQHEALAVESAANGLLQALLSCAASHKSAAAVAAAAACLQALCEAAPENRTKMGELPGNRCRLLASVWSAEAICSRCCCYSNCKCD